MNPNRKVIKTERGSYSQNATSKDMGSASLKGPITQLQQQSRGKVQNSLTNREGRPENMDATNLMMKNAAYVAQTAKANHVAVNPQQNNWVRTEIKNLK